MSKSLQQTLEQERAKKAWEDVRSVTNCSEEFKKKYGSLARRVSMLVLINGLGQTLAYLRSKGKNDQSSEYNVLFRHLSNWTMSQVAPDKKDQDLLDWVRNTSSDMYRRATTEVLAYLTWLKRFAEAELPTGED